MAGVTHSVAELSLRGPSSNCATTISRRAASFVRVRPLGDPRAAETRAASLIVMGIHGRKGVATCPWAVWPSGLCAAHPARFSRWGAGRTDSPPRQRADRRMKDFEVARLFELMADVLELRGANPFRIRAYRRAAQNVESLTEEVEVVAGGSGGSSATPTDVRNSRPCEEATDRCVLSRGCRAGRPIASIVEMQTADVQFEPDAIPRVQFCPARGMRPEKRLMLAILDDALEMLQEVRSHARPTAPEPGR